MNLPAQHKSAGRVKRVFLRVAAALALAAALFLAGCTVNLSGGSGTETPNSKIIGAKWEITDQNARFASIELTEAEVYIVIVRDGSPRPSSGKANMVNRTPLFAKAAALSQAKTAQPASETPRFYTGKYTVTGNSTVHLIDFGTLEINLSSGEEEFADIRLQLDSGPAVIHEFYAERAAEIVSSTNTDLLCRHWNYVRFLLNGNVWEPWDDPDSWTAWEFPESKPHITNLFSKAGTYLQTVTVDGTETFSFLGQWRWADENENAFYHTDWMTGVWQRDMVHVTLTDTTFAITEYLNYEYILITEFELWEW